MTNEKNECKPLEVDDRCEVLWRDETQSLPAIVIERRSLNYRKRKTKEKEKDVPAIETLQADEIEYYVHYEGQDR
jgi:hypothetical protein